jgi:hypothetical protein
MTLNGSALGLRQAKAVETAIRDLRWAAKTQHEVSGTIGKPETETWHSYVQLCTGPTHPRLAECLADIEARFGTLTPGNYKACIEAIETHKRAILADKAPMTVDKRETAEAAQERADKLAAINAEHTRKAEEKGRAARECWDQIDAKKPAWARALIVAELRQNDSDMTTDYFSYSTKRRVAIGFRRSSREDFGEMRAAAATFPETKYLADYNREHEHRENYSGGSGYYLGKSKYSGWVVRAYDLASTYNRDTAFALALPETVSEPDAPTGATDPAAGVQVKRNVGRDGLEIHFSAKPDASILAQLKAQGWRWARFSGCWYTKYSAAALDSAARIVGEELVAPLRSKGPADAGLAAMTDTDRHFEDACAEAVGY